MKAIYLNTVLLLLFSTGMYAQNENRLSQDEKLYGLSRLWSEASYNFAFFGQVPHLNWDSCYQQFIPRVMKSTNDWAYYNILREFYSLLEDGHTCVLPPVELRTIHDGNSSNEIRTQLIENKVIITQVLSSSAQKKGIVKGMEILSVNDTDVRQYANQFVAPWISASTKQHKEMQVFDRYLLSGPTDEPVKIKVKSATGSLKEVWIDRSPWILEKELFKGQSLVFKPLQQNYGYLKINFFYGDNFTSLFDSIFPLIQQTKGLIIDLRACVGGNSQKGDYILRHLTPSGYKMNNWFSPRHIALRSCWDKNPDWLFAEGDSLKPHPNKELYTMPVHILIDEGTFSSAENFAASFKSCNRGKLIGRKTAGSTGEPKMFLLPGGGKALVCTKKKVLPDGTEFVGYGLLPDIEVKKTIDEIRNNRDLILEKAIQEF